MKKKDVLENILATIAIGIICATIMAIGVGLVGINCYGIYSMFFDSSLSVLNKLIFGGMLACIDLGCVASVLEFRDAHRMYNSLNDEEEVHSNEYNKKQDVSNDANKLEKQLNKTNNNSTANYSNKKYDYVIDEQISLFENYDNNLEKNKVKVLKR